MKTFIITLLLVFTAIISGYTSNSYAQSSEGQSTRDIVVRDIKMPQGTPIMPRSLTSTVLASYSSEFSLLELSFTQPVGTVTIYIVDDMGQCVVKYTCNTGYEPDVFINVALGEGSYTLRIIGNNYEGEGCF